MAPMGICLTRTRRAVVAAGISSYPGGSGGGLVRIAADSVILDGTIQADGGSGANYSGGGSGGGVRIDAYAYGQRAHLCPRRGEPVHLQVRRRRRRWTHCDLLPDDDLPAGNILAYGGKSGDGSNSSRNGGAGTIYLKAAARQNGDLILDNAGIGTAVPPRCRAPPMRV